jgi:hypothetical protein
MQPCKQVHSLLKIASLDLYVTKELGYGIKSNMQVSWAPLSKNNSIAKLHACHMKVEKKLNMQLKVSKPVLHALNVIIEA